VIGLHGLAGPHTLYPVVAWGDVPTWLAVVGGFVSGGAALWQLKLQRVQMAGATRAQERASRPTLSRFQQGSIDGAKSGVLPPDSEPVHVVTVANLRYSALTGG
jgi:hypothetical protein